MKTTVYEKRIEPSESYKKILDISFPCWRRENSQEEQLEFGGTGWRSELKARQANLPFTFIRIDR